MVNVIQEKAIVETKSRVVQLEQRETRSPDRNGFSLKPSIFAIQEKDTQLIATRPCILVEIGAKRRTEIALFDTRADLNALSYESWEAIGKPTLIQYATTIDTFMGYSSPVKVILICQFTLVILMCVINFMS